MSLSNRKKKTRWIPNINKRIIYTSKLDLKIKSIKLLMKQHSI